MTYGRSCLVSSSILTRFGLLPTFSAPRSSLLSVASSFSASVGCCGTYTYRWSQLGYRSLNALLFIVVTKSPHRLHRHNRTCSPTKLSRLSWSFLPSLHYRRPVLRFIFPYMTTMCAVFKLHLCYLPTLRLRDISVLVCFLEADHRICMAV